MERKFNTLGVSMWSLALHGTFMDAISDLLEDMRDLENLETGPLLPKVQTTCDSNFGLFT